MIGTCLPHEYGVCSSLFSDVVQNEDHLKYLFFHMNVWKMENLVAWILIPENQWL